MSENALVKNGSASITQAIAPAVESWTKATTRADSKRRADLLRDKANAVLDFFQFTGKPPAQITPLDVNVWQAELERQDLAHNTVYAKISKVSTFFKWAIDNGLAQRNPVNLARPKAPKAYQTEKTKALPVEAVISLLEVVKAKADVVGKRDYALLLFYFYTGKRRAEIINLRRKDIQMNGTLVITSRLKGGDYKSYEVAHPSAKAALLAYIKASGRTWADMQPDDPIWLVHDRTGQHTGQALSSHGFVKNLKRYAKRAGLDHIHLHQTRHTAADLTDDLNEAQRLLDHKHIATTRIYKSTIGVKRDTFSGKVAALLGIDSENQMEDSNK